jgi:hypothetical protein
MITAAVIGAVVHLADDQQSEMSKLIDDAGPIAGLFVLVLGITLFLLWRSLNKQIKRIDPTLPEGPHDLELEHDRELTEQAIERGEGAGDEPTAN